MQPRLIKKGAEADIYLVDWFGRKAVSKIRSPKPYLHKELDAVLRKRRTIHEAVLMSAAKATGVICPFIFFVDPSRAEIIMEFVKGSNARDALTPALCEKIGRCAAMLHSGNIIHGDLTTSNFIVAGKKLVLLDFGLAYYSERTEDAATDLRLIREVFTSAHVDVKGSFQRFMKGYSSIGGKKRAGRILENVHEIEQRGRYARFT